jgi:N6-adenosine-specific RNA methylase IME4
VNKNETFSWCSKIELFARDEAEGWDVWGDEIT